MEVEGSNPSLPTTEKPQAVESVSGKYKYKPVPDFLVEPNTFLEVITQERRKADVLNLSTLLQNEITTLRNLGEMTGKEYEVIITRDANGTLYKRDIVEMGTEEKVGKTLSEKGSLPKGHEVAAIIHNHPAEEYYDEETNSQRRFNHEGFSDEDLAGSTCNHPRALHLVCTDENAYIITGAFNKELEVYDGKLPDVFRYSPGKLSSEIALPLEVDPRTWAAYEEEYNRQRINMNLEICRRAGLDFFRVDKKGYIKDCLVVPIMGRLF